MLSIIIPAYNEEDHIGDLVRYLQSRCLDGVESEIIVVDGGSTDRTVALATEACVRVLRPERRGRAVQMNYGAKCSKGDILYFLHADSIPPVSLARDIFDAINKRYPAGCYRLRFDEDDLLLRFYGWLTRFDIPAFRFGDQSLFVTREVFTESGMFREDLALMEDNEFVTRLHKRWRFCVLPDSVVTSARKYRANGNFRLQLIFSLIYTLFHMGASQKTLIRIYRRFVRQ